MHADCLIVLNQSFPLSGQIQQPVKQGLGFNKAPRIAVSSASFVLVAILTHICKAKWDLFGWGPFWRNNQQCKDSQDGSTRASVQCYSYDVKRDYEVKGLLYYCSMWLQPSVTCCLLQWNGSYVILKQIYFFTMKGQAKGQKDPHNIPGLQQGEYWEQTEKATQSSLIKETFSS